MITWWNPQQEKRILNYSSSYYDIFNYQPKHNIYMCELDKHQTTFYNQLK